jgi:hypothetical protein
MDSNVLVTLISGMFSVASALGAVFLKDYLDTRRPRPLDDSQEEPQSKAVPEKIQPAQVRVEHSAAGKSWVLPVTIVIGSFLFGMATRALRPLITGGIHYETLAGFILLIITSLALSLYHRRRGLQFLYQLEIFALWAGFASGWSLIHGGVWEDLLVVTVPWWLGCTLFGGLIVSFRNAARGVRVKS